MSNFSDFFPAAAGGGGIGQTITVGDYSYPNAISISDFAATKVRIASDTVQNAHILRTPSTSSPTSYGVTPTSNNTYATLANITSATNGGGIYFLGGMYNNSINYAPEFYWRVTIDGGTAVEISTLGLSAESQVFMMGTGYEIGSPHSDTSGRVNSGMHMMWGNASTDQNSVASNYSSTLGYYSSTGNTSARNRVAVYPAEHQATMGCPYIYFSSSCLVEFKVNQISSFGDGDGFAMIKTF
jgi:hypothetical protein